MEALKLEDFLEKIKQQVDVRDVVAWYGWEPDRSGMIKCFMPDHDDSTASMKVNPPGTGKDYANRCKCFGCGASKSVIDIVMLQEGCGVVQAGKWLNEHFSLGLELEGSEGWKKLTPQEQEQQRKQREQEKEQRAAERAAEREAEKRERNIEQAAERKAHAGEWAKKMESKVKSLWSPEGEKAREYLLNRGLSEAEIKRFRLGGDSERIYIPWYDKDSYHMWRTIDGKAYQKPPKCAQPIWGCPDPALKDQDCFFITEGPFDALAVAAMGKRVVCLGGTKHEPTLDAIIKSGDTPILLLDKDKPGQEAQKNILNYLSSNNKECFVCEAQWPEEIQGPDGTMIKCKDPGDLLKAGDNGRELLGNYLDESLNIVYKKLSEPERTEKQLIAARDAWLSELKNGTLSIDDCRDKIKGWDKETFEATSDRLMQLQIGVEQGLDQKSLELMTAFHYSPGQMEQIRLGLEFGLTPEAISCYTDPKLGMWQMMEARLGLEQGLDVDKVFFYATPEYDFAQMGIAREMLLDGRSADEIESVMTSGLRVSEMKSMAAGLENGLTVEQAFAEAAGESGPKCRPQRAPQEKPAALSKDEMFLSVTGSGNEKVPKLFDERISINDYARE